MKDVKFSVMPVIIKRWLRKPVIKYSLVETFQYWDDPTYGNGGGDWVNGQRVVYNYETLQEAMRVLKALTTKVEDAE